MKENAHKIDIKHLTRRDFLRLLGLSGIAAGLAACDTTPATSAAKKFALALSTPIDIATPNAKERDILKETAKYYSLFSRVFPHQSTGFEYLNFPMTSDQQYQFFRALNSNDMAAVGGLQAHIEQALLDRRAFGIAKCADSRESAPFFIPEVKRFTDDFPGITQTGDALDGFLRTGKDGMYLIESRTVGAQPTIFPKGTKASIFAPHIQACLPGKEGCGFNDAISVFLQPGGEDVLRNHKVPEGVINEIKIMINDFRQDGKARSWADTGALIQAKLNNHPVLIGVSGHADNSFIVQGIALPTGEIIKETNQFEDLVAIARFMHQPHPELSALTSQRPEIIVMSFSRNMTINALYGEAAKEKGFLFASTLTDFSKENKLTLEEIKRVANGGGYAAGHLKNSGVLTLVADSLEDMARIEADLNLNRETYGLNTFFKNNGVIIKLIPEKSGRFKMMAIETEATFGKGGTIAYELAAGGKGVKNAGLTEDAVSYFIRLAEVKKNAGLISPAQFNITVNTLKAAKYTAKTGLWILDFIGTYYMIKDGSYFLNDEIFRKGITTSFQMKKEVTIKNKKPETISIKRLELVNEHWAGLAQIINNKDPRWQNRTGKVLSINLTTYPVGTDALFTIDNQEVFFLSTASPRKEIKNDGTIIHEPFDTTTQAKIEKQVIALVDSDGYSMRSDVPDQRIVTSINSNQPNQLNYWTMTADPATDSYKFEFLESVTVDPQTFKQTLDSLAQLGTR